MNEEIRRLDDLKELQNIYNLKRCNAGPFSQVPHNMGQC